MVLKKNTAKHRNAKNCIEIINSYSENESTIDKTKKYSKLKTDAKN